MHKPTLPTPTFRQLVVRLLILGAVAGLIMVRGLGPSNVDDGSRIADAVPAATHGLLYRP